MKTNKPPYGDEEYREVSDLLKSLRKVDAPPGFEADLMRRINQEKYKSADKPQGFFSRLFSWRTLVPSTAGLAVVVVLIFMLSNQQQKELSTPLFSEPPLREDAIVPDGGNLYYDSDALGVTETESVDDIVEETAPEETDAPTVNEPEERMFADDKSETDTRSEPGMDRGRSSNDVIREVEERTRSAIESVDEMVPEITFLPPPVPVDSEKEESLTGGGTNEPKSMARNESMLNFRQTMNTFEEQKIIDSLKKKTFSSIDSTGTESR
jgi:hypothetical protein